ncbi:hypothetical protein [Paenibacillus polymyxa]|uniref:hypothetical protein n=1 Tax=Paenibacillus polymyxa TaxID=1406 RepID=UPI002377E5A3|nr:hypothetical protein [Paenibacillus polymyxa]WDM23110.1 hypothetical protein J4I02_06020 [Paenibacillus polymyxa]
MIQTRKWTDELLTWKWSLLIVLAFVFGWRARHRVIESSSLLQSHFNQWDILLGNLSSAVFLLYVFLPFMLLLSCLHIKDSWDFSVIIRVNSWRRWNVYTIHSFIPVVLVSTCLLLIISLLLTVGFRYEWSWSSYSLREDTTYNLVSLVSQQSGLPPYTVLIIHLIIFMVFFLVLHSFIATAYLLLPNMLFLSAFSFSVFLYAITSFKYLPFPKWTLFNYMTFYSSMNTYHSIYPGPLVLLACLLISIYILPWIKKLRLQSFKQWTKERYPHIVYVLLCVIGLTSPYLNPVRNEATVWDTLYVRFFGVSLEGGISFSLFLFYVIAFIGYVYLVQIYINEYLSGRFYYTAIRYQSLWRWFIQVIGRIGIGALIFLFALIGLTLLTGWISGHMLKPQLTVQTVVSFEQLLYHFVVNGWLQMLNYILIVFITAWLFKEASYSLTVLGVLILAALPMVNKGGWLPTELNSMGYNSGQWEDIFRITCILIISLLIEIVIICCLFRKKNIAFY